MEDLQARLDAYLNAPQSPSLTNFDVDRWVDEVSRVSRDYRSEVTHAAERVASRSADHPRFLSVAGNLRRRLCWSTSRSTFGEYISEMECLGSGLKATYAEFPDRIEEAIDQERDRRYDYFSWRTMEKSYLLRHAGVVAERPQYMWMRVALAIHGSDIERVIESYDAMSLGRCTHATPTLFNAGLKGGGHLASCFLVAMKSDSITGIFDTLKECALISKSAGGIGVHIHNVRAKGSLIKGTNGTSNGIVPMMRVFNNTARYVDQGGGRRKGSFAMYLSPHHPDCLDFIEMKLNHGADETRGRDLFYGFWVSDLFMRRVENDEVWSMFCPNDCRTPLNEIYGEDFEETYLTYEREGLATRTIPARTIWTKLVTSMIETGTPYLLFKDAINRKSNQKNIGTIQSSNLCCEIMEVSTPDETAVCNPIRVTPQQILDWNVWLRKHPKQRSPP